MDNQIKRIVIVGGGTAGWMTASALSTLVQNKIEIILIESDEIGTVGVGEATIPLIRTFTENLLGLDEADFMKATNATYKLGIEFVDWGKLGTKYTHGFGKVGRELYTVNFYQYWLKMYLEGKAPDISKYSVNLVACEKNKFALPEKNPNSPLSFISHAYHFDAAMFAKFLRKISEDQGVIRKEGKIVKVNLRTKDGFVDSVLMNNGETIDGDFFIDCSGFRGLLIEEALHTGYEDWSHLLPMDSAVAVPCASVKPLTPYTRSTARPAGWQWRIPLQHRTGNGHVFCSKYMSEDEATSILVNSLDGEQMADPRTIKFTTGMRKKAWNKNVLAIGLSGGFLEPLESTSIHMVQSVISLLFLYFPDKNFNSTDIDRFNDQVSHFYIKVRDFIILHYCVTQRTDTDFWNYVRTMPIPESLSNKINLYKSSGRILRDTTDLFSEGSWLQVLHGQGIIPNSYNALVDLKSESDILRILNDTESVIEKTVSMLTSHDEFISAYRAAPKI